jgi:hypothetical protein
MNANKRQDKRKPTKTSRKPHGRKSRAVPLPKTAKLASKKSKSIERLKASRANSNMNITQLQFMAKSRGIPFGGLNKTRLIRKINHYQ